MLPKVFLYTDGSCRTDDARDKADVGGCAAIIEFGGRVVKEVVDGSFHTNPNRMELQAVIIGLKALKIMLAITTTTAALNLFIKTRAENTAKR